MTQAVFEEFAEAAHELAEAIRQLWKCECGRWSRERPCPYCGREEDSWQT